MVSWGTRGNLCPRRAVGVETVTWFEGRERVGGRDWLAVFGICWYIVSNVYNVIGPEMTAESSECLRGNPGLVIGPDRNGGNSPVSNHITLCLLILLAC